MNFSFELSGALLTGNITPDAMNGMAAIMGAAFGGLAMVRMVVCLAVMVFMIISRGRIFTKARLPGWGILIPVYNIVLMFQLGGMSGRWALSLLFPPLLLVMMIINSFNIAEKFGKHWTYGLGIIFIKIVFIPILAFDDSKYLGQKIAKPAAKVFTKPVTKAPATTSKPAKKIIKKAPAKKVVKKVKTLTKKK